MDRNKLTETISDEEFDRLTRSQAQAEPVFSPIGFEERMDEIMRRLPDEAQAAPKKTRRTRRTRRLLTAAAALLILGTATAAASPVLLPMAQNTVAYFNAPQTFKYLSGKAAYETFNASVGASTEDKGITLTVDNIAVSDNYINVFYTVKSEAPIVLRGDDTSPESWRAAWTAPYFWFKADGTYIEPPAQGEVEAYLTDEHTLTGMQRFAVMAQLPVTFDLELYTEELLNQTGDWHIAMGVDKSAVSIETLTAAPAQKAKVSIGGTTHKITVEKVSISPFGSQLVLRERSGNPFSNFLLRDDKGNYLPVISEGLMGNSLMALSNSFEFMGGSLDMKSITMIPYDDGGAAAGEDVVAMDQAEGAKLATNPLGGFEINTVSLSKEDGTITITATPYGAVPMHEFSPSLADRDGEYLSYITNQETRYDRENGTLTFVGWLDPEMTDSDYGKIAGLRYFTNTMKLMEDQAVTIPVR